MSLAAASALAPAASALARLPRATNPRRHAARSTTRLAPARLRASASARVGGARPPSWARTRGRAARASRGTTRAFASAGDSGDADPAGPTFQGAPMQPESPSGQMLAHVLTNESHLFTAAVDSTLDRMSDELDAEETRAASIDVSGDDDSAGASSDSMGLVLNQRIQQMRALERRNGVQDLMYANILQKFRSVGVDMLPPLDDAALDALRGVDLTKLTTGVHSTEALEMVKEHLMGMLGPEAAGAYSNTLVRMSKLQAAQMYAASIMFGYFLRKADRRFKLDRAMGTLPMNPAESAASLEALFEAASAMDSMDEADRGAGIEGEFGAFDAPPSTAASKSSGTLTLKQYVQSFDQAALVETSRVVSLEGVTLAERQTGALFGSVETLAKEMQAALEEGGEPITTPDELMSRVQDVVGGGKVKTVTLPVATQRRVVLEAVAFGTFLRDAESMVDARDGRLLTPAPRLQGPTGLIGNGGGEDGDGGGEGGGGVRA